MAKMRQGDESSVLAAGSRACWPVGAVTLHVEEVQVKVEKKPKTVKVKKEKQQNKQNKQNKQAVAKTEPEQPAVVVKTKSGRSCKPPPRRDS
jgi:translation elongation factor EF-1alpha